jgi:hypothetical protein
MGTRFECLLSFIVARATTAICIALTWLGLYTPRRAVFQNNKSETKYCMLAISQKKADLSASSITRNVPRSRRLARSSRSAERAAPLWTARRNQIAARHRSACRSRFAALDAVRRRSTASAPALRAASLRHARRLRSRRIQITRNRRGLVETVAPQKWCGVKGNRYALAFGKRAQKGETRWMRV